ELHLGQIVGSRRGNADQKQSKQREQPSAGHGGHGKHSEIQLLSQFQAMRDNLRGELAFRNRNRSKGRFLEASLTSRETITILESEPVSSDGCLWRHERNAVNGRTYSRTPGIRQSPRAAGRLRGFGARERTGQAS